MLIEKANNKFFCVSSTECQPRKSPMSYLYDHFWNTVSKVHPAISPLSVLSEFVAHTIVPPTHTSACLRLAEQGFYLYYN
jgi:hypothetical protein